MTQAGTAVALYLFASGIGGFFGGPTADRYGAKKVIALSLVLRDAVPVRRPVPHRLARSSCVLAIGGFFLQSTLPVNVTFGQALAPVSAATVSSIMMGFGWGTGGLSVPFVGMIADRIGIETTLSGLALMPLVAAACALPLPARAHVAAPCRPAEVASPKPTAEFAVVR